MPTEVKTTKTGGTGAKITIGDDGDYFQMQQVNILFMLSIVIQLFF